MVPLRTESAFKCVCRLFANLHELWHSTSHFLFKSHLNTLNLFRNSFLCFRKCHVRCVDGVNHPSVTISGFFADSFIKVLVVVLRPFKFLFVCFVQFFYGFFQFSDNFDQFLYLNSSEDYKSCNSRFHDERT